jgi:cobyrinic acid a,c-diamide synthase
MGLVIAGERSGVGKTTVTLALLAYLSQQSVRVRSFKVGPDYIDPMFHRHVTGQACRNLDPVLTSEAYVQDCFARHSQTAECILIEGVMGLFDGAQGQDDWGSTAHVARLLDLPIVLVIDCSRMARSIAALVHGYRSFDPRLRFAGVVLNRVGSDRHLELLRTALEPLQVPILGVLHRHETIRIPDRHLGLMPTAELPQLSALIDRLAQLAATSFDWEQLWPHLAAQTKPIISKSMVAKPQSAVRIAIAQDAAFSFYYADNLEWLEQLGVEWVPWSPLGDRTLPQEIHGLYLGGGFPEVFAQALADNCAARQAVQQAILAGLPTYAECGGLMYLCRSLTDYAGQVSPMVGILPTEAVMEKPLVVGYRQVVAQQTSPLVTIGQQFWGHEFHHSRLTRAPERPLYQVLPRSPHFQPTSEGWVSPHLHASYIHLHWGANLAIPQRFLNCCHALKQKEPPMGGSR